MGADLVRMSVAAGIFSVLREKKGRPQRDLNPCCRRERAILWDFVGRKFPANGKIRFRSLQILKY